MNPLNLVLRREQDASTLIAESKNGDRPTVVDAWRVQAFSAFPSIADLFPPKARSELVIDFSGEV